MSNETNIIEINDLKKYYGRRGSGSILNVFGEQKYVKAVDGVSFRIQEGEILGLAGQSGCGKSTLGEVIVSLQKITSGEILFRGNNIAEYNKSELKKFRQECQVIFQDPFESLNPRFPVARLVREPLKIHNIGDRKEKRDRTERALRDAGLKPPGKFLDRIPSELSGGERQRVSIARALVLEPSFLLADEPVSMLDVSVKTGVLQLFKELQEKRNITILYVSHDLSTISYLTNRTMIMYLGNIVEIGPTEQVIHDPAHPYTETLLNAVPTPDPDETREGTRIRGEIPDPVDLPSGCRFHPNCPYATEMCRDEEPSLKPPASFVDSTGTEEELGNRVAACYHPVSE